MPDTHAQPGGTAAREIITLDALIIGAGFAGL